MEEFSTIDLAPSHERRSQELVANTHKEGVVSKKVEVNSFTRPSYNPLSNKQVCEVWDSEGNRGKGVGNTKEEAEANARSAYITATKANGDE